MIKKGLFIMLIFGVALSLTGCAAMGPNYNAGIAMTSPQPVEPLMYEDEKVRIQFHGDVSEGTGNVELITEIMNKTDDEIEIIWDDSEFEDFDNQISSLRPYESLLTSEDHADLTIIPSGEKKTTKIIPDDTVAGVDIDAEHLVYRMGAGDAAITRLDGETLRVLLPIEFGEEIEEYNFDFEVYVEAGGLFW